MSEELAASTFWQVSYEYTIYTSTQLRFHAKGSGKSRVTVCRYRGSNRNHFARFGSHTTGLLCKHAYVTPNYRKCYFSTNHSLNYTYKTKYVKDIQKLKKFRCTTKLLKIARVRYVVACETVVHVWNTNLSTFTANLLRGLVVHCKALWVALSALAIKCKYLLPAPPDGISLRNITTSVRNALN